MPHADPEKAFDVAARHLFRHLRDPRALRRNPLVRAYFSRASGSKDDDACADRIRARILQEAARCRCEDVGAGFAGQAKRHAAIVIDICAGKPTIRTAARLRLSRRQYYRDRKSICTRVARALLPLREQNAPQIEITEPLQLLFSRAATFSDQGLSERAVTMLDKAWPGIPRGKPLIAAQLELAENLIAAAEMSRADRLLHFVRKEIVRCGESLGAALRDHLTLVEARLAFRTGRDAEAGPSINALANRQIASRRCDEVSLRTMVECGLWHCASADFEQGRRMLARARTIAERLRNVPSPQQVALALLHAYCAEDIVDEIDGSHRRFRDALALSIANASVRGAVEATVGLMGYYGSASSYELMYEYAERALSIARAAEGQQHLLFATMWIGTTFMKTPYWRAIGPLLFEAEQIAQPGTLSWIFIKEAQADFLSRNARYEAARASFAAAGDAAVKLQNPKWQGIVFRDLALMLNRLKDSESIDAMQRAVNLAERSAGAWTRSLTYRAASQVLAKKRIARLTPPKRHDAISEADPQSGAALLSGSSRRQAQLSVWGNSVRNPAN